MRTHRCAYPSARGARVGIVSTSTRTNEHGVEADKELRIPIADQKPKPVGPLPHLDQQNTGPLSHEPGEQSLGRGFLTEPVQGPARIGGQAT